MISEQTISIARTAAAELRERGEPERAQAIEELIDAVREEPNPRVIRSEALLISNLGWTREETADTYHRLRSFAQDWDMPGMELYDALSSP